MCRREAASAVSRVSCWLDRLPGIEPARALEGRDLPPLPSVSPLPAVRAETRPAFRAAKRTLPRLPQTTRRGGSPYAAPSCFRHSLQVILLSCSALAVSSLVRHRRPFSSVTAIPAPRDNGSLQHFSPNQSAHRAIPPARITGLSLIAVALSDDSHSMGASGTAARPVW